jgi:hypothetical protein
MSFLSSKKLEENGQNMEKSSRMEWGRNEGKSGRISQKEKSLFEQKAG